MLEMLARNISCMQGGLGRMVSIFFTGLRPGETLHERLAAPSEKGTFTAVPKVRIIRTGNECSFPLVTVADH